MQWSLRPLDQLKKMGYFCSSVRGYKEICLQMLNIFKKNSWLISGKKYPICDSGWGNGIRWFSAEHPVPGRESDYLGQRPEVPNRPRDLHHTSVRNIVLHKAISLFKNLLINWAITSSVWNVIQTELDLSTLLENMSNCIVLWHRLCFLGVFCFLPNTSILYMFYGTCEDWKCFLNQMWISNKRESV